MAALRAYDAAMLAGQLGYVRKNKVPFDTVVRVMKETGKDLNVAYKETSLEVLKRIEIVISLFLFYKGENYETKIY